MIKLKHIVNEILSEADVFASGPAKAPNQLSLFPEDTVPDKANAEQLTKEWKEIIAVLAKVDTALFARNGSFHKMVTQEIGTLILDPNNPDSAKMGEFEKNPDFDPDKFKENMEAIKNKMYSLARDHADLIERAKIIEKVLREYGGATTAEKDAEGARLEGIRKKATTQYDKFKNILDSDLLYFYESAEEEGQKKAKETEDDFIEDIKDDIENDQPHNKKSERDRRLDDLMKKDLKPEEMKQEFDDIMNNWDRGEFDDLMSKMDDFFAADAIA